MSKKNKKVAINVNTSIYEKYIIVAKLGSNNSKNIIDIINNIDTEKLNVYKAMQLNKVKNNKQINFRINEVIYNKFLEKCNDNQLNINQLFNNIMLDFITNYDKDFSINNDIINSDKTKKDDNFVYPLEIVNCELDKQIKDDIISKLKNPKVIHPRTCENIEDLYINLYKMRYIFNYSPGEINDCFPKINRRSVQQWLKSVGWEFNSFEAQQRTVQRGRRNYKQIATTRKTTQLKNSIFGSNDEESIRQQLNIKLTSLLNNIEVIVGVNNISILENGKEVDIPIVILKDNKTYKFAVECNGDFWHQDNERDKNKKELLNKKGYRLFYVYVTGNTRIQRENYGEINDQINKICEKIRKLII